MGAHSSTVCDGARVAVTAGPLTGVPAHRLSLASKEQRSSAAQHHMGGASRSPKETAAAGQACCDRARRVRPELARRSRKPRGGCQGPRSPRGARCTGPGCGGRRTSL